MVALEVASAIDTICALCCATVVENVGVAAAVCAGGGFVVPPPPLEVLPPPPQPHTIAIDKANIDNIPLPACIEIPHRTKVFFAADHKSTASLSRQCDGSQTTIDHCRASSSARTFRRRGLPVVSTAASICERISAPGLNCTTA